MVSTEGSCNCGSISVTLNETPKEVLVCHCLNCRRAGGPYSINFVSDEGGAAITDAKSSLKAYKDGNTVSGNVVTRSFCQECGSPVITTSPTLPGKVIIKASLFHDVPTRRGEIFAGQKIKWAYEE